jgi:two-component system sensor histidine kinase ArlS
MPVRLRITFIFSLLVFVILGLVCSAIYYFSYTNRLDNIKTRLMNRAITTARLLSQSEVFNRQLMFKIDAATTLAMKDKTVQAYDYTNKRIYSYSDQIEDTIEIEKEILNEARINQKVLFSMGRKEAIAYHYTDKNNRIVVIAAGFDEDGRTMLRQLRIILLLSFCGGVIITFAVGYIFSKSLLRPVRKIADEVNEISASDFTRRIPEGKTQDEWNYLAATLNQLLNRLQESFEIQRRFISNASHELSNPLTSISSQLEISLQRERKAEEYRVMINSVYQDVKQMNKLTQTLLEFAKASGSRGGLEINPIRIDEVLLRIPSEMAKFNKQYSASLSFDQLPVEEEMLLIFGNEELLFMAIRNIVLNACKYSPDHRATIKLSVNLHHIHITIEDNGIGIPEMELENIFHPFYRVEEQRTGQGFGLGLSLASKIIMLHNGQIQVQSELNKGSLFTITFPLNISPGLYAD